MIKKDTEVAVNNEVLSNSELENLRKDMLALKRINVEQQQVLFYAPVATLIR